MRINPWAIAVIVWIGVIFFSSTSLAGELSERAFRFVAGILFHYLAPGDSSYGLLHLLADKGLHVALFLVLAVLLWNTIRNAPRKVARILVVGAAVGSASEFLQRFFPGRDPAVRDVVINITGTALGVVACIGFTRWKSRSLATGVHVPVSK